MTCYRCQGSGEVQGYTAPCCPCLYHDHGGAPCTCTCAHSSDECQTCQGRGTR